MLSVVFVRVLPAWRPPRILEPSAAGRLAGWGRTAHCRLRGSTEAFIPATPLSRRKPPQLAQASHRIERPEMGPGNRNTRAQLFRIRIKQPKEMEPCQS